MSGVFFLAAVSGTAVLLFALKLHRLIKAPSSPPPPELHPPASPSLRPCISLGGYVVGGRKGEKKRVKFAIDVVEPAGNNEDFRRRLRGQSRREKDGSGAAEVLTGGMPANRVALYNGIMRDRGVHRLAYSY